MSEVATTELTVDQKLDAIAKQVDYISTTVYSSALVVQEISNTFNMIVQGLMASPMGGMLKKQMGAMNNG